MTILDGMQPWVLLVLVIVVLVGVAVVTAARRRRSTVVIPAGGLPPVARTVTDDPVQRHRAEVDRLAAEVPTPPDRAVAGLVERVRARYRIGQDSYQSLATKVRSELATAGATGRAAAAWIVERSLADLRWEATFWLNAQGLPDEPVLAGMKRLPWNAQRLINPFHNASGFHPLIHLQGAAEVLTVDPVPATSEPLDHLLELWLALAEVTEPKAAEVRLLATLADCRRSTAAAAGRPDPPAYLHELAERDVTQQVQGWDNVETPDGGLRPVRRDDGTVSLSALARRALG
jgi:hypothetical protein